MSRLLFLLIAALSLIAAAELPAWAAEDDRRIVDRGADSGLPLPRFVALGSDKVNVRAGPGVRYPIAWQFVRKGLPVELVAEYEHWRKIRDQDGAEGWVHKNLLTGRRTALVQGGMASLLRKPDPEAETLAQVEPGVQARLLTCRDDWCQIEIPSQRGWLKRTQLWGVYANERFE